MKWKRMMGLGRLYSCYKCGGSFSSEDFDLEEDICSFCLFPETARSRPAEIGHKEGVPKNTTNQAKMLSELDYIPEKQSKQSKEAFNKYKNSKAYKG